MTTKSFALSIIIVFACVGLFAQSAYKNTTWGESADSVKEKVLDLAVSDAPRFGGLVDAMLFLHWDDFNVDVSNPIAFESGEITRYWSEEQQALYWFVDDQLEGVEVSFSESIREALVRKYGSLEPKSGTLSSGGNIEILVWQNEPSRLVVWERTEDFGFENVYYVHKKWWRKLEKAAMEKRRKDTQEQNSRLE